MESLLPSLPCGEGSGVGLLLSILDKNAWFGIIVGDLSELINVVVIVFASYGAFKNVYF